MDVISTIKVRNADGTYSDSMPIGTVSDYITIAADGSSLSSILGNVNLNKYGSLQSQINALGGGTGVADGVCYVGEDPEDTGEIPIEKINGIAFDANGDVLKAYWEGETGIVEAQLAPIEGGGGGEVPEGVTYVDLGDDDETIDGVVDGNGGNGYNDIYTETSINLGRAAGTDIGNQSVAIGYDNVVVGINSIAIGENNIIDETKFTGTYDYASNSIIVGQNNTIDCSYPAAIFGSSNKIINSGAYSFYNDGGTLVVGLSNTVNNNSYHAVFGKNNQVTLRENDSNASYGCLLSGYGNKASGYYSVAIGYSNTAGYKEASIAIGRSNVSNGQSAIALGSYCEVTNDYALAGGTDSISSGLGSLAFGYYCEATNYCSVALGGWCKAKGYQSFAAGYQAEVGSNGYTGVAIGYQAKTEGSEGVSIGSYNEAKGGQSLALGCHSSTSAYNTIAIGYYAKASSSYQTAMGKYNIEDTESKYALIFGGGEYSTPKNIFTLDWNGNAWFAGSILNQNGEDINGINIATDSTFTTLSDGNAILTVSGKCEQPLLEGLSLYKFEDTTTTQNGITVTIKDNVCSWKGTPTTTTNGAVLFEIFLNELDLSILTNNQYICTNSSYSYFDVYDLEGNVLATRTWKYYYDNTVVGKIVPHIRREYWYEYNNGSSLMMIFQLPSEPAYWSDVTKIPLEPYTGEVPAPNPNYPQNAKFSSLSKITLENENGNTVIDFGEEVTLYSAINVTDIINSTSIVRNVAKIILTGAEEIGGDAAAGYFTYTPSILGKANSVNVLSDHYRNVNGDLSETDYNIFIDANGNIRIQHSGFTSVDEYKTWLASNNVMIVYERAEAEIVALSSEVSAALKNLEIYSGETTITVDSETIQPIVKVEYPTSLVGKYVLELKNNNGSSSGGGGDNSNVDLSSVVPNTRKIAGIDLENDITVEELANALRVAQGELHVDFEDAESTDVSVSTNKATNYSLEEQCIGTWIDGKPLYQKTYDITGVTLTANQFLVYPTGLSEVVDKYINIEGVRVDDSKKSAGCMPQKEAEGAQGITLLVNESLGGIHICCTTDNTDTNIHWYVTVQYTKTTDEI